MEMDELAAYANFTAIDFETAHGNPNSICQVGLVRMEDGQIVEEIDILVQPPDNKYHWGNSRVHGITKKHTANAPQFKDIWPQLLPHIEGQHIVAHNAPFDCTALDHTLAFYGLAKPDYQRHCTVEIYQRNLALLCREYHIELKHHNALSDAKACAELFLRHLRGQSAGMMAELDLRHPLKKAGNAR
ncbi:MAG: 3'-5' exonuclease [Edaphocola sp.]